MVKSGSRKNAGNPSHSQISASPPSPPSTSPTPLSPKNVSSAGVRSFRKYFGYPKPQNMDNPISLGVEDPPTVHCTIPGQDEEDLESMTTEEILSALSLLRIFSTQHDKNQKEMKSNLADHSSAIEEQKSSTELLSTQVAELRTELGAVRNQLAQQAIKVNRAERLSNRAHSSKLHDSLRADQLVLLLNDVSPIITSQTEAPLSTLNQTQFREYLRSGISVILKHQNVSTTILPPPKLHPTYSPARLTFRTTRDTQAAKGAIIRFLMPHKWTTVRSPEPSSGDYRGAKKALSDLAHAFKSIGGLSTSYSIVPVVDENKLKLIPSLSFSIPKYPPSSSESLQPPALMKHTVQKRISLSTPIPPSGQFCREFYLLAQKEILNQIIEARTQQGLQSDSPGIYMEKLSLHNQKFVDVYSKSSQDREEGRQMVPSDVQLPAQATPPGPTSTVGRTPPHPHKTRSLSLVSTLYATVTGSNLHSGKRVRETISSSPVKPAKKMGKDSGMRSGHIQALFQGPLAPDGPPNRLQDGPQDGSQDATTAHPDVTVEIEDSMMESESGTETQI